MEETVVGSTFTVAVGILPTVIGWRFIIEPLTEGFEVAGGPEIGAAEAPSNFTIP